MKLYYNPKCGTCHKTLALLEVRGFDPEVIEYLEHPPDLDELNEILYHLGISASELLRRKGDLWDELLETHGEPSEEEALKWMLQNPILIQRPIVIHGDKAIISRPAERVLEIL